MSPSILGNNRTLKPENQGSKDSKTGKQTEQKRNPLKIEMGGKTFESGHAEARLLVCFECCHSSTAQLSFGTPCDRTHLTPTRSPAHTQTLVERAENQSPHDAKRRESYKVDDAVRCMQRGRSQRQNVWSRWCRQSWCRQTQSCKAYTQLRLVVCASSLTLLLGLKKLNLFLWVAVPRALVRFRSLTAASPSRPTASTAASVEDRTYGYRVHTVSTSALAHEKQISTLSFPYFHHLRLAANLSLRCTNTLPFARRAFVGADSTRRAVFSVSYQH